MLHAESLACERGGRLLFKTLGFTLEAGTLLRVAGPNGSGKTSLLRILCALSRPAAGTVSWNGEDAHRLAEDYTRRLAYLGHLPGLKEDLTARENLRFALGLLGIVAAESALGEALGRLGLGGREDIPTRFLSQGQKRRAALARLALADSIALWILDEPLAALDTEAIRAVVDLIAAHLARDGLVVLTTHQDLDIPAPRRLRVDLG